MARLTMKPPAARPRRFGEPIVDGALIRDVEMHGENGATVTLHDGQRFSVDQRTGDMLLTISCLGGRGRK